MLRGSYQVLADALLYCAVIPLKQSKLMHQLEPLGNICVIIQHPMSAVPCAVRVQSFAL